MDGKRKTEKKAKLIVEGAREHNLKNIDVEIPRNQLTVVTGLSGSGKSSLAFDTIYAEGNRRYLETFSAYSRGFIGKLERPDVDKVTGLSPVISIEQKTTSNNPRSTVGTTTEIYDFLRLLYARTATAYSLKTGKPLINYSEEQIYERIIDTFTGKKIYLLAPIVRDRKGHYRELLENMRRRGYLQARIDGVFRDLVPGIQLERYKSHNVEVLVDKLKISRSQQTDSTEASDESAMRIKESIRTALRLGKDVIAVQELETEEVKYFSLSLMDEDTGQSLPDPAPHTFSFNSPIGSCPRCKGIGSIPSPDMDKIIPNGRESIREGALAPLGKFRPSMVFRQLEAITAHHGFTIDDPISSFTDELLNEIISGVDYPLKLEIAKGRWERLYSYDGLASYIQRIAEETESSKVRKWAEQFNTYTKCPACKGKRLKPESLAFKIAGVDIAEVAALSLPELQKWVQEVPNKISPIKYTVGHEIAKELNSRIQFLLDVGLDYLTLERPTGTLSGGETQRIRLGTQLGSQLVNALYILDEPSIGLHQRDNDRLILSLKKLRDMGNTLIVVEHDRDIMLNADHIIDLGPRAGRSGGHVTFSGGVEELLQADSLTAAYLQRTKDIELPQERRVGNGDWLRLIGARGHNLKGAPLSIPLGTFTCITGVSGSGKSSYINDTLYPALSKHFYRSHQEPLPYDEIQGLEFIDKVVAVDQSPIGRIPRSNPVTYTGVFSEIRNLFVEMPESKIRGYKPGRFSFNVKGGRCETCKGNGYKKVEMNFLPDVYLPCDVCRGKRYNRETLEVRFKGKSIAEVLEMTINMAVEFFDEAPNIQRKLQIIQEVGLGYIRLGQPSTTLSGGESQRIKLATELMKKDTGKTIYFLDEPTTGLHFEDIRMLMNIVHKLVDRGNTVVIIEHNLDVLKVADHIIDIGPDGGAGGGEIVAYGTPEEIAKEKKGYTGQYLAQELKASKRK